MSQLSAVSVVKAATGGSAVSLLQRKCACGGGTSELTAECNECRRDRALGLQKKLVIGAIDDPLESEADAMAEQVMRPSVRANSATSTTVQRSTSGAIKRTVDTPPSVDRILARHGEHLPEGVRIEMERRFGHDFSKVRVHHDAAAGQSALDVGARAYAAGRNIVFAPNRYAPYSIEGRQLLAHELTHVVQQYNCGAAGVQREPLLSAAALEIAAQNAPRVAALLTEYGTMLEAGVVAAEEVAAINLAVVEAEAAVAAAAELAAAGGTATAAGETALVATAGLAADDVTGIGVADDVAIPFTLIAGLVGLGIGAGVAYYYREEISAAARAAADAVARVIRLIQDAVARARGPTTTSPPVVETPPVEPTAGRPTKTETRQETRPRPVPRPDVDVDLDEKRHRRRGCIYESIGQQFGRYPCHADYARSISGVPREVRITTPEGDSADFDAMDVGEALYEVKTGYRWLAFTPNDASRNATIARFYGQAANQSIVATRCGHSIDWYFNDPYSASFFEAENSPYPTYGQVPMPVTVWYRPFDCNVDSDG